MNTAKQFVKFLQSKSYQIQTVGYTAKLIVTNEINIEFYLLANKFSINGINVGRKTIFDLTNLENHSVVMLLIKLLQKGYAYLRLKAKKLEIGFITH
jgi:hypothetical protein